MRLGKKRKTIRKLAQQARERSHPAEEVLNGIPVEPPPADPVLAGKSTLVEAVAVPDPMLEPLDAPSAGSTEASPTDETVEALAVTAGRPVDRNAETEGALDADIKEPDAPDKLGFTCACGARLVATKKAYDKRMRCANCQTLMLVSLVWDPKKKAYEIVPFRVENLPDVEA